MLTRGLALIRPHRLEFQVEIELARAIFWSDRPQAVEVAKAAAIRADAMGDDAAAAVGFIVAAQMRLSGGQVTAAEVERLARNALPLLERAEDHEGLFAVWDALADVANMQGRFEDCAQAQEQSMRHARRAGHPLVPVFPVAIPLLLGPRPATEVLVKLDALAADSQDSKALIFRAVLLAMLDRIDEAWALAIPAEGHARELGFTGARSWLSEIALLAGDNDAAAHHRGWVSDMFEASGRTSELSTSLPRLGRILCNLGRYDEAESLAQRGRELGDLEDVTTQQIWRQTQALAHSARELHPEAEQLAREAVDYSLRTDSPWQHGDAFYDLAQILEAARRHDEAADAYRCALQSYERKQIIPLARRTRERLAALQALRAT